MDRKLGVLIGLLVLIGALVAVILIGRGGGDSDDSASGSVSDETISQVSEDLEERPKLSGSSATAPTVLVKKDIVVGDGTEAKEGDTVKVQYVGALYDNGKEFDASWDRGEPFEFTLGGGQVIKGWDEGVAGMKVGGRRVLVIPPDLGYGPQGSPPTIPGNSTLVFVVDLEDVQSQ
ncbi:MAG: FKBP-type peptidyl-prolyl cis-trans isomerase [Solirubrobacterales bacterium]|nr:FKBP-type peptidyl-prolyl cis-trans isomerase [Solirubrobacterales bacterium]